MRAIIGFVLIAVSVVGCGAPDDGRLAVTGTVKFKGQPIKDGATVQFSPLDKDGSEGLVMTAAGAFGIPKENGLKPGKYKVTVSLGDGKTPVNPVDPEAPPGPGGGTNIISKQLVPADWNKNQQVTVTKDGPNKFDFDIP